MIRSMTPTGEDVRLARVLGKLAVETAMAGYTDVMVANWHDEVYVVPLELASFGVRQLDVDGSLYKSLETHLNQ